MKLRSWIFIATGAVAFVGGGLAVPRGAVAATSSAAGASPIAAVAGARANAAGRVLTWFNDFGAAPHLTHKAGSGIYYLKFPNAPVVGQNSGGNSVLLVTPDTPSANCTAVVADYSNSGTATVIVVETKDCANRFADRGFYLVVFASPPASSAQPTGAEPGGSGWTANATRFAGRTGKLFTYICPANGSESIVWGTTTYTDDSSVCTAAVNYGLITVESGGTVTIEMLPGLASYTGSNRNGTTTDPWGAWGSSFVFIGQPVYNTDVGYGGSGWGADATDYLGENGQRYLYMCPPGGSPGFLWGTGTYSDDSSVCTAAVQQGLITLANGGYVTIEIRPGANSYTGSTKNGITSSDWGSWYGSYIFVTR